MFEKEELMVLYLAAAAIENQWLPSCMFEFDKNVNDWYNSWWWMDKIWMLEYICLVFSSINMNSEASYQTWAMMKWELLNEVIQ